MMFDTSFPLLKKNYYKYAQIYYQQFHRNLSSQNIYFIFTSPETELLTNELKAEAGECLVERDLNTGYEAYLITPLPLLEAKRVAVDIEDTHPLGRLFDIDVIDAQGIPVSRDRVGGQPRRCLVCDHEARYCMRMRWHTQEEIWARIKQMTDDYALQQQA